MAMVEFDSEREKRITKSALPRLNRSYFLGL